MTRTITQPIAGAALLLIGLLTAAPVYAAARPADRDVAQWVTTALTDDPRIDVDRIHVTCEDGIVTLSGEVPSLAAHDYADMEAKKIRGVLGVINQIVVGPADRTDAQIRDAVVRRLDASPVVGSQNVSVAVVDGLVLLTGTVNSWAEHEEAGLLTREVAGVKAITNDLAINLSAVRSDAEIQKDVVSSLSRDVYLTGLPVSVAVHGGIVTLSGTVGNAYERDRADDVARWVRGVADVNDQLVVDWVEDRGVVATPPVLSDAALKKAVQHELEQDWRLDPSWITVDVHMGAVTLRGTVPTREERNIAERDAHDVVGVAWVVNRLYTEVDARDNQLIQDDVQFTLDTDFATAHLDLEASVHHGVVTLSGEAENWFERSRAALLASDVPGVREVVNDITVARSSWKRDADLTETIASHLTWNWTTWWVHDDIGVTVKNGVATLSGDVNSWSQRAEAAEVALDTPGVWKVDNRLTVNGYDYPWSEFYYKGSYDYLESDAM